ncbi:conjugal transfer protein TraN [Rheinheimera hassiensis]|uniref:conjugal transfer protein TraN n=1 Tax=Rheinheimera hassiensis TaxID=1193627 RepID=UPI001F05598C|nr:conjugal transfer protein TraN [Rheinheimera hassiensis]
MRLKNIVTHSLIATMLLNLNAVTMLSAVSGINVLFNYAYAQESDTPLLDELKDKYDLENVDRNHQTTGQTPESMTRQMNLPSRNLSGVIAEQINGAGIARQIDLTGQTMSKPVNEAASTSQNQAFSIGKSHGSPLKQDSGDEVKGSYAKQGTREFYRDENGQLRMRAKENVERVSGITGSDLYGVEAKNPEHNFKANEKYGDETGLHGEGKTTYQSFKSGKSASARGFQAVTNKAQQGINTNINENEGWLQPGLNSLLDAENSPGDFFSSCQNVTTDISGTVNSPNTQEFFCQDLEQANYDYCEVERISYYPYTILHASGAVIGSCGPGCIDVTIGNMQDNVYRASCTTFSSSASLILNPALKVQSVKVVESAIDDHATLKVNGATAWSMLNGSPGSSGDLSQVSRCELATNFRPSHSGNMFDAISSAHNNNQQIDFNFDVLVDNKGEGGIRFQIQMINPNGKGFGVEIKQFPEGCYDALDKKAREDNPLAGYMEPDNLNDVVYQCSRSASLPTCSIGEVVGTVTEEQCAIKPETEFYCDTGSLEGEKCTTEPQTNQCPVGFALDTQTNKCLASAQTRPICSGNFTLQEIGYKGDITKMCTRPTDGRSSPSWSCNGPSGFGPYSFGGGSCSVITEEFYDSNNELIKTEDEMGNKLLHRSFVDTASCRKNFIGEAAEEPTSFCKFEKYQPIDVGSKNYPVEFLNSIPQFYSGDEGHKTWKVNLEGYECDPTYGQILPFTNPETGELENYTWKEIQKLPQQCQRYIDDPACREVARECTDGWFEEQTGRCMADTVTFRCDRGKEIDYSYSETTNTCSGILPCSGGDCFGTEQESNGRFVEAMVAGSILDNIQSDSSCTDPKDPSTCRIFEGEYKYCSWETTGLGSDCCEQPGGIDILAYVSFSRQMMKVGQMAGNGAFGTGAQGMYSTLSEPITSAGQAVSNWASSAYSSSMNSLFGAEEVIAEGTATAVNAAAGETATAAIEAVLAQLQQQVYSFVYDMLPDQLASMIFTETANVAAGEASSLVMNEALSNAMSNVMAVYAAYQMIKLALTLLTACDKVEMDMGIKLAQRSCFAVGQKYCSKRYPLIGTCMQNRQDYCCYSSILSRIIMKESYNQLGINPMAGGRPTEEQAESGETNACLGLTQEQLSMVDFAAPSMQSALQEWVGLLLESGEILTESSEQILTGGASKKDVSCQVIMQPVIDPLTGEQIVDRNGNSVWEETGEQDCYQRADGGQIFNADARKPTGQRTKDRLGTADERVQEAKDYMKDAANNLDCSIHPRPPVCNYGLN